MEAMASILCEIGFPPGLSNALFMVARLTGILAHANENSPECLPCAASIPLTMAMMGRPPEICMATNKGKHPESMEDKMADRTITPEEGIRR